MDFQKYEVFVQPDAEVDIDKLFDSYVTMAQDVEIANRIINDLMKMINGLEYFPHSHPKFHGVVPETRRLIYKNFIAPFRIFEDEKVVYVTRVFHARMDYMKYYY